jgi:hypothetical protein
MDSLQRNVYSLRFELDYRTKKGTEFQDWFVKVAGLAYGADFDPIRNYGAMGDFKCDGRRLSTGTIFQCYAPGEVKEAEIIAKINADLPGAVGHWVGFMREWCFVSNDPRGLPPTVAKHLDAMEAHYPGITIVRWSEASLRDLVFAVSDDQMTHLFGYAPTLAMLSQVGFADLKPVLEDIMQKQPDPLNEPTKPPSPSKIEKNNLSASAGELLRVGRLKERLVGDFLSQSAWPENANRIAKAIRDHYKGLIALGLSADEIFGRLRLFVGHSAEPVREAAELAVLSYFFHRCDIFEDPDEPELNP